MYSCQRFLEEGIRHVMGLSLALPITQRFYSAILQASKSAGYGRQALPSLPPHAMSLGITGNTLGAIATVQDRSKQSREPGGKVHVTLKIFRLLSKEKYQGNQAPSTDSQGRVALKSTHLFYPLSPLKESRPI